MSVLNEISEALQKGRVKLVRELTERALAEGVGAREVLDGGLLSGMTVVGDKFREGRVFLPEVILAARAMNAATELLRPLLVGEGMPPAGKVVIGTVKGDMHDIGKNLVKMMMEGKGLTVVDLGTDVSPARFVETARSEGAQLVACAALLTTTMNGMRDVVQALREAGLRDQVRVMVGGAPVTQQFCDEIGADVYTADAAAAADAALALCAGRGL